ncbi:MAG: DUF5060 domain-containing protein [Prolixibacteraceae bacterium]|nr:DUF5060 domain-containing protein [Prolixibacteraceae bacterium]
MKNLTCLFLFVFSFSCHSTTKQKVKVEGELQQWHKVTLVLNGRETAEWAKENPFLDYKLEATFTNGKESYTVPGFFAADGDAAETSTDEGNVWKIRFRPDKAGIDFRGKGRIVNGGKGYFTFQNSDKIWIKNGTDSPENFLAFAGFDQTFRFILKDQLRTGEADPKKKIHKYKTHITDWKAGDPTWKNGKGKGIIGALNYLRSKGINSVYMLTMNILGDGNDVWPYSDYNERYRFDCSKLDQWEIVFDQMDRLGIMMHFVLQETENECLLDMGYTGVQRRLYLRELIARFGHHLGVSWNLGEENGPAKWSPIGQTDQQRKDMANYIKAVNPYPVIVVLHTHSNDEKQNEYLTPMLGFKNLDGPSMQIGNPARVHERIKKWVETAENAGKRWIVNLDEIGPAWKGVMPDSFDESHDTIRAGCLWGTLLASGAGVEWYCGYHYPNNDLNLENFRSREKWWEQSTTATQFINRFPLEEMKSADDLVNVKGAFCLTKKDELYIIYLPSGTKNAKLNIDLKKPLTVKWFNPREGGKMQDGSKTSIQGTGFNALGNPPSAAEKDWVVVVKAVER